MQFLECDMGGVGCYVRQDGVDEHGRLGIRVNSTCEHSANGVNCHVTGDKL